VLVAPPEVDFLEIFPENYLFTEGLPRYQLAQIAERFPITVHAIGMSVGSTDPPDMDYLRRLRKLVQDLKAPILSDHLCWNGVGGLNLHSVLPIPLSEAALQHVTEKVKQLQGFFGRRICLENSPGYMAWKSSTMSEVEFLCRLCEAADCGILLDLNNLFQAAYNYGFDAIQYLDALPVGRIGHQHVGGHANEGRFLLDTHEAPVVPAVWELYRYMEARTGGVTTVMEWDNKLPALGVLVAEAQKAREYQCQKT
jgi:hypothetical protein